MYIRGTLATILSSLGNWCFDTAQRLELHGRPGSWTDMDTSDRPFGLAPDTPPITFIATSGERVHINSAHYDLPPDIEHGTTGNENTVYRHRE